jgi:hypothetical protein
MNGQGPSFERLSLYGQKENCCDKGAGWAEKRWRRVIQKSLGEINYNSAQATQETNKKKKSHHRLV